MLLNVLFPHLLATLVLRRYMPGAATAVLLNMPVTIALLESSIREGYIELGAFAIYGSLVVVGIVSSIPLLFWIGRKRSAAS